MSTSKTNWLWNCVNFKELLKVLSVLIIARKMYVALYCYNHNMDGPYPKINQTLLQIEFESEQGHGNDSFWIIDQKIRAVNEVAYLKDDPSLSILVVILSAPKNFDKRQITRKHLQSVAHRGVKWAFILGQTSKDVQVITANCKNALIYPGSIILLCTQLQNTYMCVILSQINFYPSIGRVRERNAKIRGHFAIVHF